MKTGEEKFDDEIRQKLRHSEVKPPVGFFDQIVPPSNKRRGFLWIWIAGILILGLTAGIMEFSKLGVDHHKISGNGKNGSVQLKDVNAVHKMSSEIATKKVQDAAGDPSGKLNSDEAKLPITQFQINNSNHSSNDANRSYTRNSLHSSERYRLTADNSSALRKTKNNSSLNTGNYGNRRPDPSSPVYNYDLLYRPAPALPYNESTSIKQQIRILKPDNTSFDPHTPTPFGIEVTASGIRGYANTKEETSDTMALRLLNSRSEADAGSSGFEVAAKFLYEINDKFTFSAGLHYSERKQNFNSQFEYYYDKLHIDTIQYYILFPFSPPQMVTEYDSTILHLSETKDIQHNLIFKSASVSLQMRYNIPAGSFLIEPQVGLVADVYTKIKGSTNFNPEFEERNGDAHFDNSIQIRAVGGLQIGYSLSEKYNVFILSEYRYALTSMKTAEPFYSEKTNQISLGAGVRYTIFKSQASKP